MDQTSLASGSEPTMYHIMAMRSQGVVYAHAQIYAIYLYTRGRPRPLGPILWLKKIFNTIILLEEVPTCFKEGIVTPVYKGKGNDPLLTSRYRGIALSSIMAKTLEILILTSFGRNWIPRYKSDGLSERHILC